MWCNQTIQRLLRKNLLVTPIVSTPWTLARPKLLELLLFEVGDAGVRVVSVEAEALQVR